MAGEENFEAGQSPNGEAKSAIPQFSSRRQRKPVQIEQDDGTVKEYTLVELDGEKKDEYQDLQVGRLRVQNGQITGMNSVKGLSARLISACMVDANGKAVDVGTIQKWPATTIDGLFEMCQDLNRMTKKSQEEAKNS